MKTNTEKIKKSTSIKDIILQKIHAREVLMHSKKSFAIKTVAIIAIAVIILLISAFMFNFIFFTIRLNHHGYLFSFGSQGFWLFLKIFPWGTFVVDIALIVFLEWLLQKFRFAYRVPGLYILFGLLFISSILGFTADQATTLNDRLLHDADMQQLLSPLDAFYEGFRDEPPSVYGVCDCVVTAIDGSTLSAYQKNDIAHGVTISAPPDDPTLGSVSVGSEIFAAGNFHDGVLYAFGLSKMTLGQ